MSNVGFYNITASNRVRRVKRAVPLRGIATNVSVRSGVSSVSSGFSFNYSRLVTSRRFQLFRQRSAVDVSNRAPRHRYSLPSFRTPARSRVDTVRNELTENIGGSYAPRWTSHLSRELFPTTSRELIRLRTFHGLFQRFLTPTRVLRAGSTLAPLSLA